MVFPDHTHLLFLFHILVAQCFVSFLVLQSSWWGRERERAGCFTLFVYLMSFDCYCSVAFPNAAVGRSVQVCDCGIS